jgi:hypothetical protein
MARVDTMLYTMELVQRILRSDFFIFIKSVGPQKFTGFIRSTGFYEVFYEENKKLLHKIRRTNSMVYTIVSTRLKTRCDTVRQCVIKSHRI